MKGRTFAILNRFPAHLDAARPGKQIVEVTEALACDLDVLSAVLAAIRRSHRLADADEVHDLLLIAARHAVARSEFAVLIARLDRTAELLASLAAANASERDARAETLCALWGIASPKPRLALFGADPAAASDALQRRVQVLLSTPDRLDAMRRRVAGIAANHSQGNGTVRALMAGAANALDLDLGPIAHSPDRFWHAGQVYDRLRLRDDIVPAQELLGIEENPLWRLETDQAGRTDGELFSLIRRGFGRAVLQVRVTGKESLTVGPMVVNRDEGHGVGYAGAVPAGQMLVFSEDGRVSLDGSDVTANAYAWKGACFAAANQRPADFVFDAPRTRFAVAYPDKALEADFIFPHSGESLPMPGVAVGETRFAYFAGTAFWSGTRRVSPRPAVGFADGSVFAAGTEGDSPLSALVSFSWLERRAFCVRVLIPPRFRELTPDDAEGRQTRLSVVQALQRVKPAGVEVTVEFVENRWMLGAGLLSGEEARDPIAELRAGTVLWSAPAEDV